MSESYRILTDDPRGTGIQCRICKFISFNPHDVEQRYCGNCHRFLDDTMREAHLAAWEKAKKGGGSGALP